MPTWTKVSEGRTIELRIRYRFIAIAVDGVEQSTATGMVETIDTKARAGAFRNAPKVNASGVPFTHAVAKVLLTQAEAKEVQALLAAEERTEEDRREQAQREEHAGALAEARATGKPVEIRSWMVGCNDRHEQCEQDICVLRALPDGSLATSRSHTF